jgi:uncharacterized protein YbaR (Trm112 family)
LNEEVDMAISDELLAILACPRCKGEIRRDGEEDALICDACRLSYPVREGIPVMLVDEATTLGE